MSRIRWVSRGSLLLGGVLLVYMLLSLERSRVKPLWFDELGTMNAVSQPTLGQMFQVEPGDGNPPFQYVLARASLHLFGVSALALRLPSLLFVALAIACLYVFVGRRYGALTGLFGAALLALSPLADYGVEARPYGLLLGLTMLLLVLWQRAAEPAGRRRGVLAGVAATVFALTLTHPTGFLWAGVPVLSAEGYRWWRTRRLDKALMLAVLVGFSGFLITLHFARATQQVLVAQAGEKHPAISLPSGRRFREALREDGLLPVGALLLPMGLMAVWARTKRAKSRGGSGAPAPEWVAAGALAFALLLAYLFTCIVTHYFWSRYLLPGVLGWFLVLALLCGSVRKRWFTLAALSLGVLLTVADRRQLSRQKKPWPSGPPVPALLSRGDASEPVVIGSPLLYSQIWWYSTPAQRARVHYVADAQQAIATDDFIADMTLIGMHEAGSQMFAPDGLGEFLAANKRFLLWQGYVDNGDWFKPYLLSRHYQFTPVAQDGSGQVLFQVSAPVAAP